ncbi:hypothetical protein BN1708_008395, partial [Verticillium longisporum]
MSVDLNWETLTSGPDGEALALRIRDFIHEKFQAVQLPRFIKSVTVHDFEFGSIPPKLELKDITDPLPDFYEENEDYDDDDSDDGQDNDAAEELRAAAARRHQHQHESHQRDGSAHLPSRLHNHGASSPSRGLMAGDLTSPFLGVSTPGILSGASNLHYFQSHLGSGWSGTHTPLAAVAGGGNSWMDASAVSSPGPSPLRGTPTYPSHSRNPSQSSVLSDMAPAFAPLTPQNPHPLSSANHFLREKSSVSTLAPTSVGTSRPPTRDPACAIDEEGDDRGDGKQQQQSSPPSGEADDPPPRFREPRPDDLQAVFRIRYAGDVRLRLTAEILLDYPMPSFPLLPYLLSFRKLLKALIKCVTPPVPHDDGHTGGETDDTGTVNHSVGGSDEECGGSDNERSLDDILPDVKELADALEPSTDIPLELPKHQKKSLMKLLTNFWAERSASGWPILDYPVNPSDHIFIDSDVIVREDEPSSVIAFAMSSDDYLGKLADIRKQWQIAIQKGYEAGSTDAKSSGISDTGGEFVEADLEKSLLRATGTHLKYQFKEGTATMMCKIFYAEQFDALRRKCGASDRIVESLSRCLKWDSKGGKTKSVFLKTLDDRLVCKALSPIETAAFLRFAPAYFGIMAEALFHDLPSVIAKMLGFFQIIIKNPVTGVEIKLDLLVMENLFYDRAPSRIFDLKGSMRNRKIQSTGEQNEVLLDENMVEFIYESPLFAREHSKKLLRASVWNDTLFLARQNVMDYSLMVAVDEVKKELVVGIIDCIRTYTWDKKLESWIKDRGF